MTRIHKSLSANNTLPTTRRARIIWTLGNLCMWVGLVMLLYVGGVYSASEYGRYAARGDNDEPVPPPISVGLEADSPDTASTNRAEPAPFVPAVLNMQSTNTSNQDLVLATENTSLTAPDSSVTRIVIPAIELDSKVVPVGWDIIEKDNQKYAVWQVAQYAVGHHVGSANPGAGDNIVMAGHVGGYGKVFKDLIKLKPGDSLTLYSNHQQYMYIVESQFLVTEEGVSIEQQAENARYIAPANQELVTLVTCWPATGPEKFSQRVIVRALPFTNTQTYYSNSPSQSTIR